MVAPAKTSRDIVAQFATWFTQAVRDPDIQSKLAAQGLYPVGLCGADFASYLQKQHLEYGRIVREADIK